MPTLPLTLPVVPAGGEQPINSVDDTRAILPPEARQLPPSEAVVREALVTAITSTALAYQTAAAYAAAQADITRANKAYLDGLCVDRGVPRQTDEPDATYRARTLATPDIVSPGAILRAVNALLAPHTTIEAQLFPCILDQMFVHQGEGTWHCFIWDDAGEDPDYADRYYDDRNQAHPGNTWLFDEYLLGRGFVLRVPDLAGIDTAGAFIWSSATIPDALDGSVGDGSNTAGAEADGSIGMFIFNNPTNAVALYQQIVGAVEAIRGHGIRWELMVDPWLN